MKIGDFSDFMATLTPEIVEQITDDANLRAAQIREDADQSDITKAGNQVAIIAFTYSLELLGLYHAWLEKQNLD